MAVLPGLDSEVGARGSIRAPFRAARTASARPSGGRGRSTALIAHAASSQGAKRGVLILPGLGNNKQDYLPLADLLKQRDLAVGIADVARVDWYCTSQLISSSTTLCHVLCSLMLNHSRLQVEECSRADGSQLLERHSEPPSYCGLVILL